MLTTDKRGGASSAKNDASSARRCRLQRAHHWALGMHAIARWRRQRC